MSKQLQKLKRELQLKASPKKAKLLQGFFKTGKGDYGEGDKFLGINVPIQRKIALKYDLNLEEIKNLLDSKIHDHRMVALFILIKKYQKSGSVEKKQIFNFYLRNTRNINNWDLVDLSSHKIVGKFLFNKDKKILYRLAKSKNLWEKRIAIISTFEFIRNNQFDDSLKIAEILLNDKHDLIHKAVGWMLREIGKKSLQAEEKFLKKYASKMPRTMLRYAIEKFSEKKRQKYLKMKLRK